MATIKTVHTAQLSNEQVKKWRDAYHTKKVVRIKWEGLEWFIDHIIESEFSSDY